MFKLISITIRLIIFAAVLASVQKATMQFRLPKGNGRSDVAATDGNNDSTSAKAPSKENTEVASLLRGKGINLQGLNSLTAIPKLIGLLNAGGGVPDLAPPEQSAEPERPAGPMTVIRYSEAVNAKRGKKASPSVTALPPGASATIVDGRLQIFYPSGKSKESK